MILTGTICAPDRCAIRAEATVDIPCSLPLRYGDWVEADQSVKNIPLQSLCQTSRAGVRTAPRAQPETSSPDRHRSARFRAFRAKFALPAPQRNRSCETGVGGPRSVLREDLTR